MHNCTICHNLYTRSQPFSIVDLQYTSHHYWYSLEEVFFPYWEFLYSCPGLVLCWKLVGLASVCRSPLGDLCLYSLEVVVAASAFDHTLHHYHYDYHTWTALLVAFSSDPVEEAVRVYYSSDLLHHTYHLHS